MQLSSEESVRDNSPRVTVILPCHNHCDFLERSIGSILDQTYENIYIVAVDDGSTDGSFEKLLSIKEKCGDRLTVLKNDVATGPSAARNKAIRHVIEDSGNNTMFFAMLDADDKYAPDKVLLSVSKIMEDPVHIGLVYGDVKIVDWNTGAVCHETREPYDRKSLEYHCMISNTPLINRIALQEVGLYDESMRTAEDWDLWLRITEKFIAVHLPEAISFYSVTGNNASDTVSKDVWQENWQKISNRIMKQYGC